MKKIHYKARYLGNIQPLPERQSGFGKRIPHLSPNTENTRKPNFENHFLLQNSVTGRSSWGMSDLKRFAQ